MRAGRRGGRRGTTCPRCGCRERRRAAQPGGGRVGRRGARPAGARQLVADRDRRHHDQQPRRGATIRPGLDGPPAARRSTRGLLARGAGRPRPVDADGGVRSAVGEPAEGELAPAAGLAVDVPRLPERPGTLRGGLRRRLVPHRRHRPPRRRRLVLVRRPRRRRDQVRRPPGRSLRGRERADGAPRGGRGRRDRHAGPGGRRARQGVRDAACRASSRPRSCAPSCSASAAARWAAVAPREIAFDDALPHTRSGKVMRRLLKARELGLPGRGPVDPGGDRHDRVVPRSETP